MTFLPLLLVGLGGVAGAIARYLVGTISPSTVASTLAVNVTGSLALGAIVASSLGDTIAIALGIGFCGAFTTFSTFAVETVRLVEAGEKARAIAYALGMLGAALAAVFAGGLLATAVA